MNHKEHKDTKRGRKKGQASNPGAYVPGIKRGATSAGTVPIRTGSKRADGSFDEGSYGPKGLCLSGIRAACAAWLQKRGIVEDKEFHFGTF